MQIIRTIVWVVLLVALLLFSVNNWNTVAVKIWEDLVWETKLPVVVVISFLLGWLPTWLISLAGKWRLRRRISSLEAVVHQPTASLSSTQLENAAPPPAPAPVPATGSSAAPVADQLSNPPA